MTRHEIDNQVAESMSTSRMSAPQMDALQPANPDSPLETMLNKLSSIDNNIGPIQDLLYEAKAKFYGGLNEASPQDEPKIDYQGIEGDMFRRINSIEQKLDSLYYLAKDVGGIS